MNVDVLIVDDSVSVRENVVSTLSGAGMTVAEAVDGADGLQKIQAGDVKCVLCDVNMPNMDGIEMVTEVKKDARFADLPVVMLTSEGASDLIAQAKDAGACGWIIKPFNPELLIDAMRQMTSMAAG